MPFPKKVDSVNKNLISKEEDGNISIKGHFKGFLHFAVCGHPDYLHFSIQRVKLKEASCGPGSADSHIGRYAPADMDWYRQRCGVCLNRQEFSDSGQRTNMCTNVPADAYLLLCLQK